MTLFLAFAVGLFVTIAGTPILIRFAAPLGLLDIPNPRKVHTRPIPRCGGIALAAGVIVAVAVAAPPEPKLLAILAGLAIVTAIGFWDDRRALGYLPKLAGQFAAACVLVAGGVSFSHLPLMGLEPVDPIVSGVYTVLFVVAVTNAVNLSDGLDGLAAGAVLISLASIAALAIRADSVLLLIVIASVTGGIFGFLRFNTHPAMVFLGDGGSYFLGFTIASLTILLLDDANPALSPVLALLVPGLPLVDMFWVAATRILDGRSPFAADAGHFHHKLLGLGLSHHDAVGVYYLLHALLAGGAIFLAYEADWEILAACVSGWLGLVALHFAMKRKGVRFNRPILDVLISPRPGATQTARRRSLDLAISVGFTAFIALSFLNVVEVPKEIAWIPLAMIAIISAALFVNQIRYDTVIRFCIHGATLVVIYLSAGNDRIDWFPPTIQYAALAALLVLVVLSMRQDGFRQFRITTLDTLIVIAVTTLAAVFAPQFGDFPLPEIVTKTAILLYVAEYLFRGENAWPKSLARVVTSASLCFCLGAIAYRGLIA